MQRLLRVLLRGQDLQKSGTRDVAGACVFGMKGVAKSCAAGRTIERAKQHTPELGFVVLHGAIDERGVLEAFQQAVAVGDETAEKLLARAEESVFQRVRRLMEHWRRRHLVIVLDDFEQNLERRLEKAGLYADSLRLAERHLEALPMSAYGHLWVGNAELHAGTTPSRAVEHIQQSYALLVRALGTDEHARVAAVLRSLGAALMAQEDLDAARQALERSCSISAQVHGAEENRAFGAALQALGCVLAKQGDLRAARQALERSYEVLAKVHGTEEDPDVAAALNALGSVLLMQGDWRRARQMLGRSLAIEIKVHDADEHTNVAATLHALGRVLIVQGDWSGAQRLLEHSLVIQSKVRGPAEHLEIVGGRCERWAPFWSRKAIRWARIKRWNACLAS